MPYRFVVCDCKRVSCGTVLAGWCGIVLAVCVLSRSVEFALAVPS